MPPPAPARGRVRFTRSSPPPITNRLRFQTASAAVGMSRSFYRPRRATAIEQFGVPFEHALSKRTYMMLWHGDQLVFLHMNSTAGLATAGWGAGALYDHFRFYTPAFGTGMMFNMINLLLLLGLALWLGARPRPAAQAA